MNTIAIRASLIRKSTPDVLPQLFEMQNGICDLCDQPIQDLCLAELDHSVPVILFARGPLPIEEAAAQCNAPGNLRAAHNQCNHVKHDLSRVEWFARGMDKQVGKPRIWTDAEIAEWREKLAKGGRISGRKTKELKKAIFAPEIAGAGGRIGGRKIKELKLGIFAPENLGKGGRIGGPKAAQTNMKNRTSIFAPGMQAKGGRLGSRIGVHVRCHIKRNLIPPGTTVEGCSLCQRKAA